MFPSFKLFDHHKILTILKVTKVTSQTVIMQSFGEQGMSWIISENGFNL